MKAKYHPYLSYCLIVGCLLAGSCAALSQGTAFNYQGNLTANTGSANGNFDFTFALFNSSDATVQASSTLTNTAVQVINGLFTTTLDFGSNTPAIFNGSSLWIQVGVRANGDTNAFTTLTPLQPLTPTPYAITASNLSGMLPALQLNGILADSVFPAALPPASGANLTNLPAANLIGSLPPIDGASLTNLNGSQITSGTIADAQLSTNVDFLNQAQIISGAKTMTNAGNSFVGDGSGLTGVSVNQTNLIPANASYTNFSASDPIWGAAASGTSLGLAVYQINLNTNLQYVFIPGTNAWEIANGQTNSLSDYGQAYLIPNGTLPAGATQIFTPTTNILYVTSFLTNTGTASAVLMPAGNYAGNFIGQFNGNLGNITGGVLPIANGGTGTNSLGALHSLITGGVIPFTNGGSGFNAILNVRNYGAKGDGVSDDSVAIRNCIQSAATNGNAVVYLPAGTYLLNTTNGTTDVDAFTLNCIFNPTNNTLIYGDGIDRTVLRAGNSIISQTPVFHLATGVTNFNLQGMTVDCNVAGRGLSSETYGYDGVIWFNSATNIHIAGIKGINTGGEAFDTGYSSFVTVERCIAIGSQGSGFTFSGPNGTIRDCQVYGCGYGEESYDTTRHWGAGLTIAYGAANMLVENCQFITNCMNVQVFAGISVKISDCHFIPGTYNTNYDLYLNQFSGRIYGVYVTGCFFDDAPASLGSAVYNISGFQFCKNLWSNGQLLMDNTTLAQVMDNQFISSSSSASQLVLTNSTVAEVALNYFTQNQQTPVFIYSPNNFVHNNVFQSCYAMIDIESSGNTFSGNTGSASYGYYDVYLNGSSNWILNNAFAKTVRFTSAGATGNQVINNTGGAALLWDTAASGNTFAFNNFPPSAIQSGNTYLANLQGQLASGSMNFDALNANTASVGTLSVGSALSPSALPYRAGTISIGSLSTSQAVTFSSPFPSSVGTSYRVAITFASLISSTVSASVTSKTANGFTITLNAGIASDVDVDWTALPDN